MIKKVSETFIYKVQLKHGGTIFTNQFNVTITVKQESIRDSRIITDLTRIVEMLEERSKNHFFDRTTFPGIEDICFSVYNDVEYQCKNRFQLLNLYSVEVKSQTYQDTSVILISED